MEGIAQSQYFLFRKYCQLVFGLRLALGHQVAYSASCNTPEHVPDSQIFLMSAVGTIAPRSLAVFAQPVLRPTHKQYLHTKSRKTSENFCTAAILFCPDMHDNAWIYIFCGGGVGGQKEIAH